MTRISSAAKSERMLNIEIVPLDKLKPHEGVDSGHLEELRDEIESDGNLKFAITVCKNGHIILDGHHRVAALNELGCAKIPVVFVDYSSSDIEVRTHRQGIRLTKEEIIEAGMSSKKLPPKTSRHMIRIDGTLKHISAVEKRVDIPLEELKQCDE